MRCIIVDDEPIARKGMQKLVNQIFQLELLGCFNSAEAAADFLKSTGIDLVFLDINMPGINGIEFARSIPKTTLVIFTTAYSEYALDSYELDAVDYLVKPIDASRFRKAVEKAIAYHSLLVDEEKKSVEDVADNFIIIKSDGRFFKIKLNEVLFIEGLKDYVIIKKTDQQIITRMTIKNIYELLPSSTFIRINRSYIVNKDKIDSFNNNDVFILKHEIAIGSSYRESFFKEMMRR